MIRAAAVQLAACVAVVSLPRPAQAQQTGSVSSLYLSDGSELDFSLYGANGGAGTNGTNSDRIASGSVFNYSSASPGTYIVGFSHGDNNTLTPGSLFTLVTFSSTNFTAADATHFTAVPKGKVSTITGNFLLNPGVGGTGGTLQFQLAAESDMPEPAALLLFTPGAMGLGIGRLQTNRRRERGNARTAH